MTFLNPFVLFGLAAAAIPILIHLLNQRNLPTIEFSTLSFLKEMQRNKIRKIKIRQWLLLLLRTLLILALVLAFSRPALQGTIGFIGSHAKTSMFIILDNTASMELHNEQGKYLAQVKTKAQELLSLMQEGDDAVVLRLSDVASPLHATLTYDRATLNKTIGETEISYKRRTIEDALRIISQLLPQSQNINKEVYVLTDGQRSTFFAETSSKEQEQLYAKNISLFVLACAAFQPENAGIETITIPPSILLIQKPVSVFARIRNYGENSFRNRLVSLEIDGKRVMQKSSSVEGGKASSVEFSFTPQHSGFISGKVQLEDDDFPEDNNYYFALYIPKQLQLLMITPSAGESQYISAALSVFEQQNSSTVTVQTISPAQFSERSVENKDVLILCGVQELSQKQQRLLQHYAASGGGILFFPSQDTVVSDYGKVLNGINLSAGKLRRAMGNNGNGFTFQTIDAEFPIFRGMFKESKKEILKNILSPSITTILYFPNASVHPVISLSDGTPFLWSTEMRRGKIIGFSVPAVPSWSDFPLNSSFLPFLHQSLLYLATGANETTVNENRSLADNVEISSNNFRGTRTAFLPSVVIRDPNNQETIVQTSRTLDSLAAISSLFEFRNTSVPGIYTVLEAKDTIYSFAENINRKESETELSSEKEIKTMAEKLGFSASAISFLQPKESVSERVLQSRFGIELWKYFLFLACILAVVEMIIGREPKQESL